MLFPRRTWASRVIGKMGLPIKSKEATWPVPGLEDTELGVFMKPEVGHGTTAACTGVQA